MDPLSVTASIISIVQLSCEIIKYLSDVKDAPEECRRCQIEVSNTQNLLLNLQRRVKEGQSGETWFNEINKLKDSDGPLSQYKQALEELRSRLQAQDGFQRVKRRLLWKFNKEEVRDILTRMERLKTIISIALENDHFKLAQEIQKDTSSMRASLPFLQTHAANEKHNIVMQWLSPIDFSAQQQDIISRRQDGTAQWFIDSPEFKSWLQGSDKTLFCPGIPGAGKTMLAAVAIDHLYRVAYSNHVGVTYLFCSYKAQVDQSTHNLLAALSRQLVLGRPDLAAPVAELHNQHSKRGTKLSLDELMQVLQKTCSSYKTTYMVIDALDECSNTNVVRDKFIQKLRQLQAESNVRLLLTSRNLPDITKFFRSDPQLEVRASDEDVRCFVISQIPLLPNCIQRSDELKNDVQNKIVESVDGMFLLAGFHIESLLDQTTTKKVRMTLAKLQKGSEAIDCAYKDALDRINGQLPGHRDLARRALAWITYAQRLLTTDELRHALAIELGESTLDYENLDDIDQVVSVCSGLVTVDKESNIIRLTHYTTQEYFEKVRSKWNPDAQEEIAAACLTYLSFNTFKNGSSASDEALKQRLAENPFFDYSAHYWNEHIRPLRHPCRASELALTFLYNTSLVDAVVQAASIILEQESRTSIDIDSKDSYRQTPLLLAARGGHGAVVQLLLATQKVDIDAKDKSGQTPLWWAAQGGHEAVVQLLLATQKVDVDAKDEDSRTPLSWAAWGGHEAVVQLLLTTQRVDVNAKDWYGRTPLSWAAKGGHEAVVQLLLATQKVDVDAKDESGQTPLLWAAKRGHEAMVRLLLATQKVDVDTKDEDSQTPLSWAARGGHEAVVQLLLATQKVDVDAKDWYGRTPLSWAAQGGHEAVVRLLQAVASASFQPLSPT
ncbi:MAG: hypothetical protein M1822_005667 [Bathelium mastoideum]|nr:MAG: hypothetical protein M1822_005667 [Bathelium mastoideum]